MPRIVTLSDSTLLLSNQKHVCVYDHLDGQPLGDIIGGYGGCFLDGTFTGSFQSIIGIVSDNFNKLRTAAPAVYERLRVACAVSYTHLTLPTIYSV